MKFPHSFTFAAFLMVAAMFPYQVSAQSNGALFTDEATAKEVYFSGNMHEAVRHFDELLRVDSLHYEYNLFAGYAYLNSNIDPAKAVLHFRRAQKNPKADPYIPFYLGKALMRCYRFDEAEESFRTFISKGLKLDKNDLPPERYIAMCENAKLLIGMGSNVTLENLGGAVNTDCPDYNAYINADETELYFNSQNQQNSGTQLDYDGYKMSDVYVAEWTNGQWGKSKKLQSPVNSALIDEIVGLSADGSTLLLYFNNDKGFDDLFLSQKEKKQFTRPEMLSLTVNSNAAEEAAMLSPDGNWLFFSSNRPGGYGGMDIYYSRKLPNGEWSNPKNAGANINTEYDDNNPYIAPDGTTFYFCSKGHNSMGGYDIFRSSWEETEQFFSIPENLSFPINTPDDNRSISVTQSGRYAYVADFRANSMGDLDIYKVTFHDVPAPYTVIRGSVAGVDSTTLMGELSRYRVEIRDAGSKQVVGIYRPDLHDGKFTFILQPGFYMVDYYVDGKLEKTTELSVADREPSGVALEIELGK
ncbi:MAG: PD40 domain-containing protein [Bacteroidales bacterium]|nr:PD40 domain-containing protein [Bacteroidales bacterium]